MECSVGLIARLHDILASGEYTSGKFVKQFESAFKEEFDLQGQCIAVNGCQNGLFLVLVALGVHRPLLPDFTFSATAHAAYYACRDFKVGDCHPRTFNLEPKVKPECDCAIVTHLFGNPADCQQIHEIANEHQIPVIYDAAHAIGATYKGQGIGDMGTASVFSLSPTKTLTAAEGGMVVTSNRCLADKLRKLRNYGNESDYDCKTPGSNSRLSEFHSIIGLESLSTFRERQKHRFALVEEYQSHFSEDMMQVSNPLGTHAWKDFSLLLGSKREKVEVELTRHQIPYKRYFRPISDLSSYKGWLIPQKNALRVFDSIIQLPLHDNLEIEDVRRIAKVVLSVVGVTEAPSVPHVTLSRPSVTEGVKANSKS